MDFQDAQFAELPAGSTEAIRRLGESSKYDASPASVRAATEIAKGSMLVDPVMDAITVVCALESRLGETLRPFGPLSGKESIGALESLRYELRMWLLEYAPAAYDEQVTATLAAANEDPRDEWSPECWGVLS